MKPQPDDSLPPVHDTPMDRLRAVDTTTIVLGAIGIIVVIVVSILIWSPFVWLGLIVIGVFLALSRAGVTNRRIGDDERTRARGQGSQM